MATQGQVLDIRPLGMIFTVLKSGADTDGPSLDRILMNNYRDEIIAARPPRRIRPKTAQVAPSRKS